MMKKKEKTRLIVPIVFVFLVFFLDGLYRYWVEKSDPILIFIKEIRDLGLLLFLFMVGLFLAFLFLFIYAKIVHRFGKKNEMKK
jgi:ABC-type multidrug transport system fused ATPase/permease subunit